MIGQIILVHDVAGSGSARVPEGGTLPHLDCGMKARCCSIRDWGSAKVFPIVPYARVDGVDTSAHATDGLNPIPMVSR